MTQAIKKLLFVIGPIVVLQTLTLSSAVHAESQMAPTPIDRIQEEMAAGEIRKSAGLAQTIYYLLDDQRYDSVRFGETPDTPNARYDCSATAVFRELYLGRRRDRNLDPYGMLWKAWIEEARRIEQAGSIRVIGSLDRRPIRIFIPKGRLHRRAPSYRSMARVLEAMLAQDRSRLLQWRRTHFGNIKISPWEPKLLWPPSFLAGQDPYLNSYFDKHPLYDAGREKKWQSALNDFLKAAGVTSKPDDDSSDLKRAWTWVISDRVQRNVLIWGPEGESLLFLSPRCLDRALAGNWRSKLEWQRSWRAAALQEILSAFYLNGKPKAFYRDAWMDAVLQSQVQRFLDVPDVFYRHGPFFMNAGAVTLAQPPRSNYLRWGSAPLWRFLDLAEGSRFIQKHFENFQNSQRRLLTELRRKRFRESTWVSFVGWSLGLQGMPESLHGKVNYWLDPKRMQEPQDMALSPIDPPRGSIAQSKTLLHPYSVRFVHIPIEKSEDIAALRVHWQPKAKDISGYLYLAKDRRHEQGRFLDFTPLKPALAQEVLFTSDPLPSEAFFVVINEGKKSLPPEALQLQITVLPNHASQ